MTTADQPPTVQDVLKLRRHAPQLACSHPWRDGRLHDPDVIDADLGDHP